MSVAPALADGDAPVQAQYKLVLSSYSTAKLDANDINLRVNYGKQRAWLAYYEEQPTHFKQARTGYERTDQ